MEATLSNLLCRLKKENQVIIKGLEAFFIRKNLVDEK